MRVLVLFAHPLADSFHATLHSTVLEALREAGHEIDDCDLYQEKFNPVLSAEERRHYHDPAINPRRGLRGTARGGRGVGSMLSNLVLWTTSHSERLFRSCAGSRACVPHRERSRFSRTDAYTAHRRRSDLRSASLYGVVGWQSTATDRDPLPVLAHRPSSQAVLLGSLSYECGDTLELQAIYRAGSRNNFVAVTRRCRPAYLARRLRFSLVGRS
jgi:hypothetical protein